MTYPVTVSSLSSTTTEKSLSEFFSFCGKISSIQHESGAGTATITFEKQQAAKTALMLNGGTLDGNTIHVTSDTVTDEHDTTGRASLDEGSTSYEQHDKPRAGIVAELLAKGYVLSEHVLHKAIEVDQKQGISTRFLNYMRSLDKTLGEKISGPEGTVSGKAKEVVDQGYAQAKSIDEQHGISKQTQDYYSRAVQSPFGQKVMAFYTQAAKQVADVHEEAKRIAELEKEKAAHAAETAPPSTAPTTAAPGASY
ncbi:SubName: Full=Related to SSP120-secretory protein {ECO:0000313/EMBL:CCA77016.1} [Serendipita indica DSM 11827]|uniref:Related to SSP120-secretory protein n=1 Tax=Serendipita indica (strain DSM 11827) TaxID=1109443 RepID=G4U0C3_SERID|nr:SubName: Full=Related to SSP120-secretory protein {ECO:0000313/EMBL:CCA77016.1} [Serendipita indica DSM 11827]CCA77016.1 related to SSP120-secretory protein [Serendipita indica DSM 11827]